MFSTSISLSPSAMRPQAIAFTLLFPMFVAACSLFGDEDTLYSPTNSWEPWPFEELSEALAPPCLSYAEIQVVINSREDYERLRREYAPQGEYVDFQADGIQKSFHLPYQPLDVNKDGKVGPHDLIIYVRGGTLLTRGGDELTSTIPIRMEGDSILVFQTSPPYTVYKKIHHAEVFMVDPVTSSVTFANPPPQGSSVSISASRRLYEAYKQRECNLNYLDLTEHIIIGKSVTGNGCLKGLENEVFLDEKNRRVIYWWRKVEDTSQGACPEVAVRFTKWIAVDRPPDGYEVVFVEDVGHEL